MVARPASDDDLIERIVDVDISDEMETSFLEYAYSVIYSRALPDARDGLKPVQRRILYTMDDMGIRPDRPHVKSARVVGQVMGLLHPHGDSAIYDALVRMAQPWAQRLPLVDGHGNFGSLDAGPAAMRYTECRMAPAASAMTAGLGEDTVDFRPNYDGKETEPVVLPAAFPNLLVNGSTGIAVGMATNIPPHNLIECVQALKHLIAHPDADAGADAVRPRPRPAHRRQDRRTGRHSRRLPDRPRHVSHQSDGAHRAGAPAAQGIVVTELPYMVGPERVIEQIKTLVQAEAHRHRRHQTSPTWPTAPAGDRDQNGFNPDALLEQLYKATKLEDSFRHQRRRAGRRAAAHAEPARHADRLPRSTSSR
ncbi:MAG: DNA gyrase subunit A [Micropruina glycogenica]